MKYILGREKGSIRKKRTWAMTSLDVCHVLLGQSYGQVILQTYQKPNWRHRNSVANIFTKHFDICVIMGYRSTRGINMSKKRFLPLKQFKVNREDRHK